MINITFPTHIENNRLQFVVIMVRHQDKWLFLRRLPTDPWTLPGGYRREEETIESAAQRILLEKIGIQPSFLHPVSFCTLTQNNTTLYGKLFLAHFSESKFVSRQTTPEEIALFEGIPRELFASAPFSMLYEQVQCWLNLQSNAGELWDIYTKERQPVGRLHSRGTPLSPGDYHLVVHIWIQNNRGQFLLTKRSPNKGYPNMWECSGGSALAGDDSLTAALREVREETGLILRPENGHILMTDDGNDYIGDIWLFHQDFDLDKIILQPGETCDACAASAEEILEMYENGTFVPYKYIKKMFHLHGLI